MWSSSPVRTCRQRVWSSVERWSATHPELLSSEGSISNDDTLCVLVFLTTRADSREYHLQIQIHTIIQLAVTSAHPHQDNLLLSGQQVAVTPVCSWHWECPHDASLAAAAAVVLTVPKCCFSSCYGSCCWELSFFYLSRVYLLSRLDLLEVIFIPCSLSYRVSLHVISKLPTLDKTSVKQTLILSETFEFQV